MTKHEFEISQNMRDLADHNMKQAHAAYDQLTSFVTQTMHAWMGALPANPVSTGFQDVQDRAMDFAKDNAESIFSFAGKICNAHTSQEVLALQTQFAQDRMEAIATHTQELVGLIGNAVQKMPR